MSRLAERLFEGQRVLAEMRARGEAWTDLYSVVEDYVRLHAGWLIAGV